MGLLLTLAIRSLASHRAKSLIVGSILFFGTALVVVGLALLDGVETAMRRSITGSVAGDFQLYDKRASDPLVLLGATFISVPDVGRIERFEEVRAAVERVDGVEAVVPMGFDIGTITTPGELERALERLRRLVRSRESGEPIGEPIGQAVKVVRALLVELKGELEAQRSVSSEPERLDAQLAELGSTLEPGFWAGFDEHPLETLERLDTRVAPLEEGGKQLLFRFMGTDLPLFADSFSGFQMVKGQPVPEGRRGFLFSEQFHEGRVKHQVARAFDRVLEDLDEGLTIREDPGQQSRVRRMARQWRRITRQLDDEESREVRAKLLEALGRDDGALSELLEAFLTVSDENARARHAWFYEVIAPRIDLYALDPGDTVTIRTYTRTGFLRAVNVTFYGTFSFRGLEDSELAGIYNLTDLVTFRELFGVMSPEERGELAALRQRVGLQDVPKEAVEEALFGGESALVEVVPAEEARITPVEAETFRGAKERGPRDTFDPEVLRSGLALNAAVVLDPGQDRDAARGRIEEALQTAGLEVQIADWQSVAGLIGQFVIVIRLVLYVAIAIIFVVALIIINNSMVMATMERVKEIGTLRAIGARRALVLGMFFMETLTLAVLAGLAGAGLGAGLVAFWGRFGLPAPSEELRFLFGGPELFPELSVDHIAAGLVTILVVSLVSTAYPAALGASVQPVEAMRTEE